MIIPLNTDRPLSRTRIITPALMFANLLVYGVMQALAAKNYGMPLEMLESANSGGWDELFGRWILDPNHLKWYTFITSAFMHAGWMHIAGNLLFLWTFGGNIEDKLGRLWFVAFYFAGAFAAGGLHVMMSANPALGASGAIAACTGAYLILFPRTGIRCLCFFFYIGVVTVPAWWFIGGSIAWDVFTHGFNPLGSNVAWLAHLGGYIFGAGTSLILLATKLLEREPWDLFSQIRQAKRRADIRAAVEQAQSPIIARASEPTTAEAIEISGIKAQIATLLAEKKLEEAAREYASASAKRKLILARGPQLDIANQLFAMGEHAAAARAYELFIETYADDAKLIHARVMLSVTCVRYLKDKARAAKALDGLAEKLFASEHRPLVDQLNAELSAMP